MKRKRSSFYSTFQIEVFIQLIELWSTFDRRLNMMLLLMIQDEELVSCLEYVGVVVSVIQRGITNS